jgi:hypothetical protein
MLTIDRNIISEIIIIYDTCYTHLEIFMGEFISKFLWVCVMKISVKFWKTNETVG